MLLQCVDAMCGCIALLQCFVAECCCRVLLQCVVAVCSNPCSSVAIQGVSALLLGLSSFNGFRFV